MAFDEGLAERIRETLIRRPDFSDNFSEKQMFGGISFMCHGQVFVGIFGDVLMARVGPNQYRSALAKPHVREMDITGKPMNGYVFIDPPGFEEDEDLEKWVLLCRSYVQSLPAKSALSKKSR